MNYPDRFTAHPEGRRANLDRQAVCAQLVGFANTDPDLHRRAQRFAEQQYRWGQKGGLSVPVHDLHSLFYYENMLDFIRRS